MRSALLVLAVSLLLSACGGGSATSAGFCSSSRRVVNGTKTDALPWVVLIRRGNYLCTGSFISDSILITASHCVKDGTISYNGTYANYQYPSSNVDLAVAVFPSGTFQGEVGQLASSSPSASSSITIIGYGQTDFVNDNPTDKQKRIGCNQLKGFADVGSTRITHSTSQGAYLHYTSPISTSGLTVGDQSMSGRGDSGGPIIIDGKIAGVVSFGNTRSGLTKKYTLENDPNADGIDLLYAYEASVTSRLAYTFFSSVRSSGVQVGEGEPSYSLLPSFSLSH